MTDPTGHRCEHRFRARLRAFPWLVAGLGVAVAVVGHAQTWLIVAGAVGPVLAAAYLLSPAWRLRIVADEAGLEIRRGADEVRLRLAWSEVARVLVVPKWQVAFVDGGEPQRSLLVTGPGAPGPYRIERREALIAFILAHVPADKVEEVESLERAPSPTR